MVGRLVVAAALFPIAYAFLDTVPFVAWSSKPSQVIDQLSANGGYVQSLLEKILSNEKYLCKLDALIFVEQKGLHASDLRDLSPQSQFMRILEESSSQLQIPYLTPQVTTSLSDTAKSASRRCGTRLTTLVPGTAPGHYTHESKSIVSIQLPSLEGLVGGTRRDELSLNIIPWLSDQLDYLANTFPNYLVIYAGSSPATFSLQHFARQSDEDESITRPVFDSAHKPINTTLPKGGILKRYQLLTPGLITVLLVTLFVLVPMVLIGFKALASIQSPMRVEAPKGYSASEKKTQ